MSIEHNNRNFLFMHILTLKVQTFMTVFSIVAIKFLFPKNSTKSFKN